VDITLIFFIYGLAFFSMGLVMVVGSSRSPILAEESVLRPLGAFGILHGCHEWIEMFLLSNWFQVQNPTLWNWLRVGILIISFTSLLIFGILILSPQNVLSRRQKLNRNIALVLYVGLVILMGVVISHNHSERIIYIDVMARYFLAVPGAAMAGIGLYRQARRPEHQLLKGLGPALQVAGWGFILYALTQFYVPSMGFFPADRINSTSFSQFFGFPIQVIRASLAVLITISLIWATQLVDEEHQHQFLSSQKARMETLNRLEREMRTRESMRQDLLRHIVVAQEDERARVARELHDETAQILTAFSFHLAALRNALPARANFQPQLDQLQILSRQMSAGIYQLVRDLRPAQLDDLGLVPALQYQCDEAFNRTGLKVHLAVLGERRRLDKLVETVLYRVAQEALTNVARHAGVQQAELTIAFQPNQVSLSVIDHGKGFHLEDYSADRRAWGLEGMRERAESVDGNLLLRSTRGSGTEVEIIVPINNGVQPPSEFEESGANVYGKDQDYVSG
jgi:signal transduction histidine kinase